MTIKSRIQAFLADANGRRRTRTVSYREVIDCLRDIRGEYQYSHVYERVANAYRNPAETTMVLAAAVGSRYYLGITSCTAKQASPGRAWPQLQPWIKDVGVVGNEAAKWATWITSPDVIELTEMEVDVLLGIIPAPIAQESSNDDDPRHYSCGL